MTRNRRYQLLTEFGAPSRDVPGALVGRDAGEDKSRIFVSHSHLRLLYHRSGGICDLTAQGCSSR